MPAKAGVPRTAKKFVEFQINKEDENGDIVDCDHRDTLEEARDHFFKEEEYWSIERVERWIDPDAGVEYLREHELVEQSDAAQEVRS